MTPFNTRRGRAQTVVSPVLATPESTGSTFEGGAGYARDTLSATYLYAVNRFSQQDSFYEDALTGDQRYVQLLAQATTTDPEWTAGFLRWLRSKANMRSAAIVGGAEYTHAALAAQIVGSRAVVNSVLQRADEPGEALAYWYSRFGQAGIRTLPPAYRRGIGDAALRLYNQYSYLKYDGENKDFRFSDVIELTQPGDKPKSWQSFDADWQKDLFRYIIEQRHKRGTQVPESLNTLRARKFLMGLPVEERRGMLTTEALREAGMTWEALAGWLQGPMDKQAWEAIIPTMGYMALLRNLRNFDENKVSDKIADEIAAKLMDPAEVAKSYQLPMRFLSAYRTAPSLRWSNALERALQLSLGQIPELPGRTLILVDRSGSMWAQLSRHSDLNRADAAAIFGLAMAQRCADPTLVEFGSSSAIVPVRKAQSLLPAMKLFNDMGGTNTAQALRNHYNNHQRVVVVTDEQAFADYGGNVDQSVPANIPMYTINVAGYQMGHAPAGRHCRHTIGGLNDQSFSIISMLEAGENARWPWMTKEATCKKLS